MLDIKKKEVFIPKKEIVETAGDSRSSWQKPELILEKLGDISGKKVADIGAGTGYFSYRLAFAGAIVDAMDVDKDMISLMSNFKDNLPTEIGNRISPRLVDPNNPSLNPSSLDAAIIINTIAYFEDKRGYLSLLNIGLKTEAKVMIVDYKTQELDFPAPPMSERLSINQVEQALKASGFKNIVVDDISLDYQYIITAQR